MFGKKKKEPDLPPLPDASTIKESVGTVPRKGVKDVGIDDDFPPPAPSRTAPKANMRRPDNILDDLPELPRSGRPPARHEHAPKHHEAHPEPGADKGSPPLFIKIDRYRDIVRNINELKSYSLGMRDALDALSDIEKELSNAIGITQSALDKLNTTITMLDTKLLRIGVDDELTHHDIPSEMDDYMKNLYDRMEQIKHELKMAKS